MPVDDDDLQTLALFSMKVIDDDVIEISKRAFAEAKINFRRNCWRTIDNVDLEEEQPPKKLVFSSLTCIEEMTTSVAFTRLVPRLLSRPRLNVLNAKKTNVKQLY